MKKICADIMISAIIEMSIIKIKRIYRKPDVSNNRNAYNKGREGGISENLVLTMIKKGAGET